MSISSLGAYSSIQALNLFYLLGSNSTDSSDDTSGLGLENSSDSLSLSAQALMLSQTQGSNPFKADFDKLGELIESGDLAGARKAYAAMQEKMQAHGGGSEGDPMATDLAAIGKALESGDAATAKSAWQSMQSKLQSMGSQGPGGAPPSGGLREDMDKLGSLMDSRDLAGAKSLFKTMQERMAATGGDKRTEAGAFSTDFEALGTALDAGDADSVRTAWTALQKDMADLASKQRQDRQTSTDSATGLAEIDLARLQAFLTSSNLFASYTSSKGGSSGDGAL